MTDSDHQHHLDDKPPPPVQRQCQAIARPSFGAMQSIARSLPPISMDQNRCWPDTHHQEATELIVNLRFWRPDSLDSLRLISRDFLFGRAEDEFRTLFILILFLLFIVIIKVLRFLFVFEFKPLFLFGRHTQKRARTAPGSLEGGRPQEAQNLSKIGDSRSG